MRGKAMAEASLESDGIDVFVLYNGVRIAKRGDPNSEQAGTWVSLKPSYRVFDKDYPAKLIVHSFNSPRCPLLTQSGH
jgi:hypothetical protein